MEKRVSRRWRTEARASNSVPLCTAPGENFCHTKLEVASRGLRELKFLMSPEQAPDLWASQSSPKISWPAGRTVLNGSKLKTSFVVEMVAPASVCLAAHPTGSQGPLAGGFLPRVQCDCWTLGSLPLPCTSCRCRWN